MVTLTDQKDKLRIAIFTDSYFPYISGVVRSIEILTGELENRGHEAFIFAPDYPLASKKEKVYRYLSLPAPTQPGFYLPIPISPRLPALVQNLKIDLIHVHTPFLLGSLGYLTSKLLNLPLVFTYHTLYHCYSHYLPLGKNISSTMIKHWNKRFCNRCDLIIAPSLFVKKLIERSGISSPVDVIPTGLQTTYYSNNHEQQWLRNKFKLRVEEKILLYVGRLGKEKNISFLLDALERITKNFPYVRLVIVGTGPEESNLKLLCRQKQLNQYVIFAGKVDDRELLKCYAGADIFTFASQTETQGLVIGEAKASGLPVVSLFSPCLSEIIFNGKDGFLVHNLQDFTDKLTYMLENEDIIKEMGKRGKINAIRFSSHLLVKKMLTSYYKVIQAKSGNLS